MLPLVALVIAATNMGAPHLDSEMWSFPAISMRACHKKIREHWRTHTESLLIITGTMGAGKTSVMGEASDILAQLQIVHAAIDLDALGLAYLPSARPSDDVMYENLRSICKNYAASGVQRFLLARAIEDSAQLKLCREMVPVANTLVCRVTASIETVKQRVQARNIGILQREYVARTEYLGTVLDHAQLEDFVVDNEDRQLAEVARQMLVKARWI